MPSSLKYFEVPEPIPNADLTVSVVTCVPCELAAAPIALGVILIVLAADPLKVNKLVPSVAPPFNLTIKLELTLLALLAAPPTESEPA